MAIPPWTVELLRRGLSDVARKAGQPETIEKIKTQATEILQELPQTAARGIDAVMRRAEAGKKSVERWTRKHTTLAIPTLNAGGVLLNELGDAVPLADEVVEVGRELFAGGVTSGSAIDVRLQRLLPSGDDYAIAIASSFPAALTALSLLVAQRQLVVHRMHAVRLPDGSPLPDAFGMLVPVIQEVGSVDQVDVSDFVGLDSFCAIVADGGERAVELMDFGGLDAMQAVVLPVATFAATANAQIPSAESALAAGADFVILPGDGVCGGPGCGVLVGRRREIESIMATAGWSSLTASDAVIAMMLATLEMAGTGKNPVEALLAASEDNLRDRAERMATRLRGSDSVAGCLVTADDARLTSGGRWRLPSRQVRVRHRSVSAEAWRQVLVENLPAVIATADGDDLRIDLRWIAAADDGKVADALVGPDAHTTSGQIDRD